VNHSMTWSGAFINSKASSTITVKHKQQGHMHVRVNLHKLWNKVSIFLIFSFNQNQTHIIGLEITQNPQLESEIEIKWQFYRKLIIEKKVISILPDNPYNKTNDWDKEAEKCKGKTQEKTQGSAITIWIAHNFYELLVLCFFRREKEQEKLDYSCFLFFCFRREEWHVLGIYDLIDNLKLKQLFTEITDIHS
jgi:hypothetical protein